MAWNVPHGTVLLCVPSVTPAGSDGGRIGTPPRPIPPYKCFDLHPELMHCRDCNQKGHLKGSDKCPKMATTAKDVKSNHVQLTETDLKMIANFITTSATPVANPTEPAAPTAHFAPPRIQIHGR